MSIEISEVAYHEAGHAIVAVDHGFYVTCVSIERNEKEKRWDGQMERRKGKYQVDGDLNGKMYFDPNGPLREIAIACAGFLAQAKHHACIAAHKVRFSDKIDYNSLLVWMKHPDPQLQSSFELSFVAIESGNSVQVSVQPRWFGGIDRGDFLQKLGQLAPMANRLDSLVIEQLRDVAMSLDRDGSWRTVSLIASSLIARCETNASISEVELNELLSSNCI